MQSSGRFWGHPLHKFSQLTLKPDAAEFGIQIIQQYNNCLQHTIPLQQQHWRNTASEYIRLACILSRLFVLDAFNFNVGTDKLVDVRNHCWLLNIKQNKRRN